MSLRYVISPGNANELVLTEDEIISHNPVRVHTGLSDLSATIVENRTLDDYAQRQDRLNVEMNGDVKWAGYIIALNHNIGEGRSRLRADGIAKRLKETRPDYDALGGSLTYSSISLEDALQDYWARTPFSNYSVTPQSTTTVATDTTLQTADTTTEWENITNFPASTPAIVNNGSLEVAQTSFTQEGEAGTASGSDEFFRSDFSDGIAARWDASGESRSWTFTPQFDISASNFSLYVRLESNDAPELEATVNNTTWTVLSGGGTVSTLQWEDVANTNSFGSSDYESAGGGDFSAGTTYTVTIDSVTSGGSTPSVYIDVIAPLDNRYNYTFDNDNGGSDGYLDGPELYPDAVSAELNEELASFNISESTINSTWDDVSNNQAIAVSNDGGDTYLSASNTSSTTQTFTTAGRTGQVKFTFSRYGSRTTATPQTGFNGQSVDDYELLVDGNDLVVIDQLELSRNHFENLQQLHQYGSNWNWTIEHDSSTVGNMTVTSYQVGDETRSKPSVFEEPEAENAEVQAEAYFNSIYLQGTQDSAGDRPIAEIKDQDAINNDGREISPGVLRDQKITTEDGALFRARTLLETALSNNELVGEKTLPSDTLIEPGYQYPVDFGNGDNNKTLEEVALSESTDNVQIRARFSTPRSDLSSQIEDLKRRERDLSDNV